ncbi:PROTEIN RETICULATA-RELATED 2 CHLOROPLASTIC-RELATED [Salix purpurea]|uniref:PROTEIN RETICULATA-RELATED 2 CHLOROPLASTIC-RELATED n=1 Tax=Salix purpurea TaxID=77065 RepID=A0A9Q0VX38_SALPP|nr:PROTEIN RETICULATA-RELATED 2 CHLOROPLASTIC-RELATED [Salix purpurea]
MALATFSTSAFSLQSPSCHHQYHSNNFATASLRVAIPNSKLSATPSLSWTTTTSRFRRFRRIIALSSGGGDGGVGGAGNSGGGGGGNDDGDDAGSRNKNEAILALAEVGRSLESLPKGFGCGNRGREGARVDFAIECGVGIFTKTAAELERRREKFTKELDFVFADVVMAIIADFMLVWLPAPTVSLRPPLAVSAGQVAKFFYSCPDNAFQVALAGTSYSFAQRIGAIMRNGSKLFAVGTGASLIGVGITNALIKARKALDKSFAGEAEDVPVLSTSVAYGVYMAVSSNLRYQVLAGVIEQRIFGAYAAPAQGVTDVGGLCTLGWNPKGTRVECREGKFGRDFSMAAAA